MMPKPASSSGIDGPDTVELPPAVGAGVAVAVGWPGSPRTGSGGTGCVGPTIGDGSVPCATGLSAGRGVAVAVGGGLVGVGGALVGVAVGGTAVFVGVTG
jgi:hypothetical protein